MAESEGTGVKLYGVGAYEGCLGEASMLITTDRSPELHLRRCNSSNVWRREG